MGRMRFPSLWPINPQPSNRCQETGPSVHPPRRRFRPKSPRYFERTWQEVLCIVVLGGSIWLAPTLAAAVTLNLNFDDSVRYLDPLGIDRTDDLVPIMREAARQWTDAVEDDYAFNITYKWGDLGGNLLGLDSWSFSGNRTTNATITFDIKAANGVRRNWFFDQAPFDNSEFNMQQTLFRDLGPAETGMFTGNVPAEFEAGFTGSLNIPGTSTFDLLSVALHEIGHAMGVPGSSSGLADGDYDVNPALVRNRSMAIRTDGGSHLPMSEASMFASFGPGERRLLSATDVLAAAAVSNWTRIDLPRQDFIAAGGTSNDWVAANWIGGQTPGAADDAFIRSRDFNPTVRLVAPAFAKNLFVGMGDNLVTNAHKLDIGDTVTLDGALTDVFVNTGGELEARQIIVQNDAALIADGGLVDTKTLNIRDGGLLLGNGGTVAIGERLVNDGAIHATGGMLTIGGLGTHWDLDGTSNRGVLSAASGDLLLQMLSPLADDFNGTITVGRGNWFASAQPFRIGTSGLVQLNGGTTLADRAHLNVDMTLAGTTAEVHASGRSSVHAPFELASGRIRVSDDADLEFAGSAAISGGNVLVGSGGKLRFEGETELSGSGISTAAAGRVELNGQTSYGGGTITASGRVDQNGNATVHAPTIINSSGIWDLDGSDGDTVWQVNDDLTLNVDRIETGSSEPRFNGTLRVDGTSTVLTMNTSTPWTLDGATQALWRRQARQFDTAERHRGGQRTFGHWQNRCPHRPQIGREYQRRAGEHSAAQRNHLLRRRSLWRWRHHQAER